MDPVLEGQVLGPPVGGGAAVVGHDVHDDLEVPLVRLGDELLVEGVVTETGIYLVVVRRGITVVGTPAVVVKQQGGVPNGGGAEVGDIVQMVDDALQVASVAAADGGTVGRLGRVGSAVI